MNKLRIVLVAVFVACGGGKPKGPEPLARADELKKDKVVEAEPDASIGAAPIAEPPPTETKPAPPPPAALTFELKNEGATDVVFSTTKGWQSVLFAYTGTPPKAKTVYLFEANCTASCDAGDNVCPVCPVPTTKKEELAMAKTETARAGGSVKVPWDGKVVAYQKAPAGKKCKCFSKADVPADSYTIKACGLRQSNVKGKPSKAVCAQTTVALPAGGPQTVTLSFK
jgi:hypothetical protein